MDPIDRNNTRIDELKQILREELLKINSEISCHDVRMVPGVTHTNLIFDIVNPFSYTESDDELKNRIMKAIFERTKNVYCVITVDMPFV